MTPLLPLRKPEQPLKRKRKLPHLPLWTVTGAKVATLILPTTTPEPTKATKVPEVEMVVGVENGNHVEQPSRKP